VCKVGIAVRCDKCEKPVLFLALCEQHWVEFWNQSSVEDLNSNLSLVEMLIETLTPWKEESRFYITSCCGRLFIGREISTSCGSCGATPVYHVFDRDASKFCE
jgi:hypothetical protein